MISYVFNPGLSKQATFLSIALRSSAYAMLAYFLTFVTELCMIIGGASIKNYEIILNYNSLKIHAAPKDWDQETVLMIYLLPYLFLTIISIGIYIKYQRMGVVSHFGKIFLLWLIFFILFRFLGVLTGHIIFGSGISYAFHWLYMNRVVVAVIGISAMIIFYYAGSWVLKGIIYHTGTYHVNIRNLGVRNLVISSVAIPVILTGLASLLFNLPEIRKEELTGFTTVSLMLVILFFRSVNGDPNQFAFKEWIVEKTNPVWIFTISIAFIILLRIVLSLELFTKN
jgi:hypothetical protein